MSLLFLAIALTPMLWSSEIDQKNRVINLSHPPCPHGIHAQDGGPFAVLVSCEDALGNYLGIIYYKIMGVPGQGKWDLSDRFWQDPEWGNDVTAYAWSPDGKYLYVSTSAIYGEGGIFELDLLGRKARKLYPRKPARPQEQEDYMLQLSSLDFKKKILRFVITTFPHALDKKSTTMTIRIPRSVTIE